MTLNSKEVYVDNSRIAVKLPLIPELQKYQPNGYFPLIEDPKVTGKASFIGMFVLRPASFAWSNPIIQEGKLSIHDVKRWAYNVAGFDGGWLIANGNVFDASRLALQYGLADAVFVGSTTAAKEGTPHDGKVGYIWHPANPASWPHVMKADPQFLQKILRQRRDFQNNDHLSTRKYPAQFIVSQSGNETQPRDILQASIFHERDIDGNPIEAYILTSETGAQRIRERSSRYGLESRMDDILIPLSPSGNPNSIDLSRLPKLLHDKYDIKIVNHDGGATVLSEFSKAGILPQMNLTLMRRDSLYEVIHQAEKIPATKKLGIFAKFSERVDTFFGTPEGSIPKELVPAHILVDEIDQAAVVTFDARGIRGFK